MAERGRKERRKVIERVEGERKEEEREGGTW